MAVRFDADAESYENASMGMATGPVTLLCWAKAMADRVDYATPFCLDNPSNGTTLLIQTDNVAGNQYYGYFQNSVGNGNSTASATTVDVGEWWALCLIWNGSPGRVYWKPTGGTTATLTANRAGTFNGLSRLMLGESSFAAEWFNGSIANFKAYSAALTQTEVETEWNSWSAVRTSNLVAHYKFQNGPQTTDDSGNGKTLTGGSGTTYDSDHPSELAVSSADLTKFFLSAV